MRSKGSKSSQAQYQIANIEILKIEENEETKLIMQKEDIY